MKKNIVLSIIFIILGFIIGTIILKKNINESYNNRYYFLLENIYTNDDLFEITQNNIKQKLMEYKDDKIYIYVAITKDLEVAEKIVELYSQDNININIQEKIISNEELKNNIEQFDILVKSSSSKDEILKIEEVVIASYQEIKKNNEN